MTETAWPKTRTTDNQITLKIKTYKKTREEAGPAEKQRRANDGHRHRPLRPSGMTATAQAVPRRHPAVRPRMVKQIKAPDNHQKCTPLELP